MNHLETIEKLRDAFICETGNEPTVLHISHKTGHELSNELAAKFRIANPIGSVSTVLGMRVSEHDGETSTVMWVSK